MPRINESEILRYQNGLFSWTKDQVVEERLVEIWVNARSYVSVMATPRQLDYLAIGYLFSEGAIDGPADIESLEAFGLKVRVEIRNKSLSAPARARSSGFGLGSVSLKNLEAGWSAPVGLVRPMLSAEYIIELMAEFNQLSELFRQTGAVHSAWLLDGPRKYFAEDVGRHNALDKVIGQYLAAGDFSEKPGLLLTTGRISTEMLLKAARVGAGGLISRGSASAQAVDLAEKMNMILIGFARDEQFKVFQGGELMAEPGPREDKS